MNWLQKIASPEEYLHNDADYDYEITWDHEVDEHVSEKIKVAIINFQKELESTLIPQLGIFRTFKIEFVNSLYYKALATYISGTYSSPVIAVDIGNTEAACEEIGEDCLRVVKMSILHELAHAIQESQGKPFDEDEAESFAVTYYYHGEIENI